MLASCAKDDDDNDPEPTVADNKISATVNGQEWEAKISSVAVSGGKQIYALKTSDSSSFQLFIPEEGTGNFDLATSEATLLFDDGTSPYSVGVSGMITLETNTSDEIKGTFQGEIASHFADDTLTIDNGVLLYSR